MNAAIFRRTSLDSATTFSICSLGTAGFIVLFSWAMSNMGQEVLEFVNKLPFMMRMLEMSLGIKSGGELSMRIVLAVALTHLIVLSLGWGVIIAAVTRTTISETERGTADLLFALPISRSTIFRTISLVWLLTCLGLACAAALGIYLAGLLFVDEFRLVDFLPALGNLFCLHLFVAGMTALASVTMNRRSHVVGVLIGVLMVSAAINFVEPFLEVLRPMRLVSILSYFRPVDAVRNGEWPWLSMVALVGGAALFWAAAWIYFTRRDIHAA